jgi:hypothetical protein
MMMFILVITGCGGGDNEGVTISGQMTLPPNPPNQGGGGAPVVNTQLIAIDFEQPNPNDASMTGFQTIGSGTTDSTGKFVLTTPQTSSAAVIANGTQPSGPQQNKIVPISGLMNLDQDTASKNFDGVTTIACFAGILAIQDALAGKPGLTPQQLNAQRISNLEQAAAGFVAQTNFLDTNSGSQNSIVASATQVRLLTADGAHP